MLLAREKQGYSRYKANTAVQVGLNIRVEIKKESQGEKPGGIRWKNYYSEKNSHHSARDQAPLLFPFKKKRHTSDTFHLKITLKYHRTPPPHPTPPPLNDHCCHLHLIYGAVKYSGCFCFLDLKF